MPEKPASFAHRTWQRLGATVKGHEVVRAAQDGEPLLVVLQLLRPPGLGEIHHLRHVNIINRIGPLESYTLPCACA